MIEIEKKYVVDENNKKIAVEIDINIFNKIEEILENYSLYKLMKETDGNESLNLEEAKKYYSGLK